MQYVYWFRELANLRDSWAKDLKYGELYVSGFPIPAGFVISPAAKDAIVSALGVANIADISGSSIPDALRKKLVDCYFSLDAGIDYDALTAGAKELVYAGRRAGLVRIKSRTHEFENIKGSGEVLEAVLRCLSDGGPVVIQKMVRPEKSGFARASGSNIVVKAAYGDIKLLTRRGVEPDVYHLSKFDNSVQNKTLGKKQHALILNDDRRLTQIRVPSERSESFSLHQKELEVISLLVKRVEQTYPGRVACWGLADNRVYLLGMVDASSVGFDEGISSSYSTSSPAPTSQWSTPEPSRPEPSSLWGAPATPTPAPPVQKEESGFPDLGFLASSTPVSDPAPSVESRESTDSAFGNLFASDFPSASTPSGPRSDDSIFGASTPSVASTDSGFGEPAKPEPARARSFDSPAFDSGSVFSGAPESNASTDFSSSFSPAPEPVKNESNDIFSGGTDIFSSSSVNESSPTSASEPSGASDGFDIFASSPSPTSSVSEASVPKEDSGFSFGSNSTDFSGTVGSEGMKIGLIVGASDSVEQASQHGAEIIFARTTGVTGGDSNEIARRAYSILKGFSGKQICFALSDKGARRFDSQALDGELAAMGKAVAEAKRQGVAIKDLTILLPFVTSVSEIRHADDLLVKHGMSDTAKVGIVVETPAAASIIDELCKHASFVAVNVDGLVENLLMVRKDDATQKHLFNVNHGAVLNAAKGVARTCKAQNVPVYAYGESAILDAEHMKFLKDQNFDGVLASSSGFVSVKTKLTGSSLDTGFGASSSESSTGDGGWGSSDLW